MGLALRQDVYYCIANEKVVLLDLRSNALLCLPSPADAAFRRLTDDKSSMPEDTGALSSLFQRGLLIEAEGRGFTASRPQAGMLLRDLAPQNLPRASLPQVIDATVRQLRTIADLRVRPIHRIVADLRNRKQDAKRHVNILTDRCALQGVAGMLASRRLIATQDKCLRWSIAMAQHLAPCHAYPQLVFGVRMQPFAAHAWVQAGDIVLNDSADRAMQYTPLLVV